ncbi:hypothetical protein FA95DRAFT_1612455 [Auriscalpium vulgare]|uniref:Uncharacterized protein n=1 Tax=Auriscalpium vulgare TaxID=40419 RepID=A0ACB8R6B3_9AGAM|nr:hypothetical protein FA95DRAFT_1612455 [Auriscalpium vulgare]
MRSTIHLNIEVSPGRVIVVSVNVSPLSVSTSTSDHTLVDPFLTAWTPEAHPSSLESEAPAIDQAINGLIRRIEVALNLAGGEGGWSEITMEEVLEQPSRQRCVFLQQASVSYNDFELSCHVR